MLSKRLIICLDVRNRMVTKGVRFVGNEDVGDPVEMGESYAIQGVDELVFYDIMASAENRGIDIEMVREIAKKVFIPFSVGGGIRDLTDMRDVLLAGAEKVSLNSLAVKKPSIIRDGAEAFGNQCIVLSMDVKKVGVSEAFPSGYQVFVKGGREATSLDALEWAQKGVDLGAGELCINSIDADGTKSGYDLDINRMINQNLGVPLIASGGAGTPAHIVSVLNDAGADAALIASMVHFNEYTIDQIKLEMKLAGIPTRFVH
jgi:imidazole glycerol-phosphate synthase subunit HisF